MSSAEELEHDRGDAMELIAAIVMLVGALFTLLAAVGFVLYKWYG